MNGRVVLQFVLVAGLLVGCGGGGAAPPAIVTPVLANPANAGEVDAAPTNFSWSSAGADAQYRLVLVALQGHQTPATALANNTPVFETTTAELNFAPDGGFPPLAAGTAYAWHVIATLAGQQAPALPFWFRIRVAGETVSRAGAMSTLLNRLIVPATLERHVTCYLGRNPLPTGTTVSPWDDPTDTTVLTAPAWFAWIDDEPEAFFSHDTRFVFIDVVTGAVTVKASEWWPEVDGESCFNDDDAWQDHETIIYSERNRVP